MKWSSLFNRIGKQSLKITQKQDVVAVFEYEYLKDLLKEKKTNYEIPLALNYGSGEKTMWFIARKDKEV